MKKIQWFGILFVLSVLAVPARTVHAEEEIRIDGYYDDWERIPKATLTYGSHNAKEKHEGAIVMGEEYLYGYVRLSDLYASQIPVNEYHITVNGETLVFYILGKDEAGNLNPEFDPYQLANGTYLNEIGLFQRERAVVSLGDVALTVTDGSPNDTLEFRIQLSVLEKLLGFPEGAIKNGAEVSFRNPNLGAESIQLAGTSTGVIAGTVLCVASVGAAWFFNRKRKQRV